MTKPFLIIQLRPEDEAADDELRSIRHYGGLDEGEVVRLRVEDTGLPDIRLDAHAAIIVGGSPFDISTPESEKPPIQRKIESDFMALLDAVVGSDFPFLGACSGNGLLGKYCGATISRRYAEPVGGADITLTHEGARDSLLEGLPRRFRVLLGHKEACDSTPAGATLLITGNQCPVQMFRVGENVYATQFHPEADPGEFRLRIDTYREYGYFEPQEAEQIKVRIHQKATPYAQTLLRRFVERYYY